MNRKKIIEALENSLDFDKNNEREMRLHYLLAKLYARVNDFQAVFHFTESQDLLEYLGKNGFIGFRNFYRYGDKLDRLEFFIQPLAYDIVC